MNKFGEWLERKFIQWQSERWKRGSIREFSEWLGMDQKLVARWMSGNRKPGLSSVKALALKLGPEVYELLGLPNPDADLLRIEAVWDALPATQRLRLAEQAEEYAVHAVASKSDHKRKSAPVKDAPA